MCNLYQVSKSADEVASLFGDVAYSAGNVGSEIYPGHPGLVFDGQAVRSMVWGFPLALKGKNGQPLKPKPINNTRTDKLDSGFWKASFRERRCLIPLTAFAEAEGAKGAKTRTWLSVPGETIFTCAGLWRDSAEWGPVFSMIMVDANAAMAPIHDRMPVIIAPADRGQYLARDKSTAKALCVPYSGIIEIERTNEPWVRRRESRTN